MKQKKLGFRLSFLSILTLVYFCIAVPLALFYFDEPFVGPYNLSSDDQLNVYMISAAAGLVAIPLILFVSRFLQNVFVAWIQIPLLFVVVALLIWLPLYLLENLETDINRKISSNLVGPINSNIPDNIFEISQPSTDVKSYANKSKGIVFYINKNSIDFEESRYIFRSNVEYPLGIDGLDFIVLVKDESPVLLRELTKSNWIAEIFGYNTRRNYKLYRIDSWVGIYDWKEKKLMDMEFIKGDVPDTVSAKYLDSDEYYRLNSYKLKKWLYKGALSGMDAPEYESNVFLFLGLIVLPLLVVGVLRKDDEKS